MKPKNKKTKKNSNYQTGFTSVVKHFREYDRLREQPAFAILLDMEAQSEKVGRFIRHVFVQLREHTGTMIPKHMEFRATMNGYLDNDKHTSAMHYKGFLHGAMQEEPTNGHAIYAITAAYYGALTALGLDIDNAPDEQSKQALGEKNWQIWNRMKLLTGLFENKDRLYAGLKSMNARLAMTEENLLEFGDEIPSPQDLMMRLSFALHNELKDSADRLVGMLQMVRDKLDPGEYAYFSAMVYMKESDRSSLEKARKELEKIPQTAAEYGTSRGMLAEVLARTGEPERFIRIFDDAAHIGQLAMWGYVQRLILNMSFQSVTEAGIEQAQQSLLMQQLRKVFDKLFDCYPNDLYVNRDEPEYFFYLENVLEAAGQVCRFFRELPYVACSDLKDAILPGTVSRAYTLLEVTAAPYQKALQEMMEKDTRQARLDFVTKYFNFSTKGSRTAVAPRLELMLRATRVFLLDEEFVDSFLGNYRVYEQCFDERLLRQWLTETYFTALSCEHPQQAKLREYLDQHCPDFADQYADDMTYRSVWGMLSGPGKLLYASAETSYRTAMESDYGWKDAGMLSLGFFRLVEVELRQTLLVDVLGKNDPDVRQWLRDVDAYTGEDAAQARAFTLEGTSLDLFRTLIAMKKPENLTMEQMEYCFGLLSEKAVVAPQWQGYQDALRQKLYGALSEAGIQAAKENRFAQAIGPQQRQMYRNPPAHARYLPIEKAGECRNYVNQIITTLYGSWLA